MGKIMRLKFLFVLASLLFCSVVILGPVMEAEAFRLPDTGQTKCYQAVDPYAEMPCEGTGQDGEYSINPLSYTVIGTNQDMVLDNNTGLTWQRQDDGSTYSFDQAGSYCSNLGLSGYADWRLPTKKELISILDYSIPYTSPAINPLFTNTKPTYYWSASTFPGLEMAWEIGFNGGYVFTDGKSQYHYVRCVRGDQPITILYDNGNGTVTDKETGLIWQQGEAGYMTFNVAVNYCEGLSLGGFTDWRLPNIKELESLTDSSKRNPSIDTIFFPYAYVDSYLSSTADVSSSSIWNVFMYDGQIHSGYPRYYNRAIRCVRGGQSLNYFQITHQSGGEIGQQSLGIPFPIRITARDQNGGIRAINGTIAITDTSGTINPAYVYITNGSWQGTVTISRPVAQGRISSGYGGAIGYSAAFDVQGTCTKNIDGIVMSKNNQPIAGAIVTLYPLGSTTSVAVWMTLIL